MVVTGRECARLRSPSDDGDEATAAAEGKDIGRGLGEAAEAGDGEIRGGSRITVVACGVGLGQRQGRDGGPQKLFVPRGQARGQVKMGRAAITCVKKCVCVECGEGSAWCMLGTDMTRTINRTSS